MMRNQPNVPLLGYSQSHNLKDLHPSNLTDASVHISTTMRVFEEVEASGSEIVYRCPNCRDCKMCKHPSNEIISCKEEVKQSIINSSITINFKNSTATALLPFVADPETRLANNRENNPVRITFNAPPKLDIWEGG